MAILSGKTPLCRVIAGELPPETTILIVDADASARGLGLIYDSLSVATKDAYMGGRYDGRQGVGIDLH